MIAAILLACALQVPVGWHTVILTTYWPHLYPQNGEVTWLYSTATWVAGPTTVYASAEGAPSAFQWTMDMTLAGECGQPPDPTRIFKDGFETGDSTMWGQNKKNVIKPASDDPWPTSGSNEFSEGLNKSGGSLALSLTETSIWRESLRKRQ